MKRQVLFTLMVTQCLCAMILTQDKDSLIIEAKNLNTSGSDLGQSHGNSRDHVYFIPDQDQPQGGSSAVLSSDGTVLESWLLQQVQCITSPCLPIATYNTNLDLSSTQNSGLSVASQLKVMAWIPNSTQDWAYAYAGWWLLPRANPALLGDNVYQKTGSILLDKAGTMSIDLSYTKDQNLTIQFRGEGIDENDANESPPRYTYVGTGQRDTLNLLVSKVRRAGWSIPLTYDASKVNGIGFIRYVAASTFGAIFPTSEPEMTDLEFWGAKLPLAWECKIAEASDVDPGIFNLTPDCKNTTPILNQNNSPSTPTQLCDSKGVLLRSGYILDLQKELESGVYLLRQGNAVESLVIQ